MNSPLEKHEVGLRRLRRPGGVRHPTHLRVRNRVLGRAGP
jgi:hypothetical protein